MFRVALFYASVVKLKISPNPMDERRDREINEYNMRHGMDTHKTEYVVRQLTLKNTTVSSL